MQIKCYRCTHLHKDTTGRKAWRCDKAPNIEIWGELPAQILEVCSNYSPVKIEQKEEQKEELEYD